MPEAKGAVPGLCLVGVKITKPRVLSAAQLSRWHDERQIPRLMGTGGFSSVVRAVAGDDNSEFPFLSVYVMPDVAFARSETFRAAIGLDHADDGGVLPGSGKISDMIEVDFRIYRRLSENHADGKISGAVKSFALVEAEAREPQPEDTSRKQFEENFVPFLKTIPSSVHAERYALEEEWWSAGGCLYNRDRLDLFGFDEEEPDHRGNFERLLSHPSAPRLENFNFDIRTFVVVGNVQAGRSV
ncbi:hypothetical protein Micbo1qcDRAFT_193823 [Microdochium bolleyi]|uniref:EthD domain-containing protein n=1 Tax=Microdochium bolleyi TaxID=196109 RepID=A0A136JC30_9PEZI|nr:hypothetical protein Micbo1qcDRAFT_193823 [Microdochium bolleyi]